MCTGRGLLLVQLPISCSRKGDLGRLGDRQFKIFVHSIAYIVNWLVTSNFGLYGRKIHGSSTSYETLTSLYRRLKEVDAVKWRFLYLL
jgi:hypothetical protein